MGSCAKRGCLTSFHLDSVPWRDEEQELVRRAICQSSVVVASAAGASWRGLQGDDEDRARLKTLGPELVAIFAAPGQVWCASAKVGVAKMTDSLAPRVLEPTGMADAFHAGFLSSLLNNNWNVSSKAGLRSSLMFASEIAAACGQQIGARYGLLHAEAEALRRDPQVFVRARDKSAIEDFRFDFALSFASRVREKAKEIRDELVREGFRVFYDKDYEHEMLGQDGHQYLQRVYFRESKSCIVLVSEEYDKSEWTRLENESVRARELRGERGVLIPVMLDDHRPDWLLPTRIYFDLAHRSSEELVRILIRREETNTTGG